MGKNRRPSSDEIDERRLRRVIRSMSEGCETKPKTTRTTEMKLRLTLAEGTAYVTDGKFPGIAGQVFSTQNILLQRRGTSLLASSFDEMSSTIATLPYYLAEFYTKVEERRETEFEIGKARFRIGKGEKKDPEELIGSLTRFWSKSEPLLKMAKGVWESLPAKIAESFETDLILHVNNLGGLRVDQRIELCFKETWEDPYDNKRFGCPPIRYQLPEIKRHSANGQGDKTVELFDGNDRSNIVNLEDFRET